MRIALAQLNFLVGDVAGNAAKIERAIVEAQNRGAAVVLAPELSLLGYPPKDILLNGALIAAQQKALKTLARSCRSTAALIGWAAPRQGHGKGLFNCASLLYRGKILASHHKTLLPYYDVFDEGRYFEPGEQITICRFQGRRLALSVCEDIWNDKNYWEKRNYAEDPLVKLKSAKPDLLLNISASPYWIGKPKERLGMMAAISKRYRVPLAYANAVGGNDELIFDGSSMVLNAQGKLLVQGPPFKEGVIYADLSGDRRPGPDRPMPEDREAYEALVLGTRDYVLKCGFKQIVLGLSGGIDSSLVAAIAADAVGPKNVLGISLPSRYSSGHSKEDAESLARNFGIGFKTISIEPVFQAYLNIFGELFSGLAPNIAEENIQARIRGALLMAVSNKSGHLVLATGNKSELAMGYCTLYGDLMGGLAPISDLPKMMVYRLARYRNTLGAVIPERVFTKAPSAELKPDQTDQDTLPPYELLDAILEDYIVNETSFKRLKAKYPPATALKVLNTVDRNEFKRRQAPPGLKITQKAFGVGRRMPIACRIEHE